jgi:hypothetical protein
MQIRIVTVTTINAETGEAKSESKWQLDGHEVGLGSQITQIVNKLKDATQGLPSTAVELHEMADQARTAYRTKAVGLAHLIGLPREELDMAMAKRPAGRVMEVLEWIRGRKQKETIRNVTAMFWSVVSKD